MKTFALWSMLVLSCVAFAGCKPAEAPMDPAPPATPEATTETPATEPAAETTAEPATEAPAGEAAPQ